MGLSTEQLNHLGDDLLPEGVYAEKEAAIIRYAQTLTRDIFIDDATYSNLAEHFSDEQIVELCMVVGLSNMVNRFHATFQTDVDDTTTSANAEADRVAGACTLPRPEAVQV
ncbi:carboxymuconolactone decarboxylase family protein [Rubrobacter indicoceani]|uniref:carboxymuconolactone decarboxylase family protein n=1 Tax=Rubrobacter indicoceani TaxID=2051957 RepID=UPI000E5B431E|nr:carboxymuconolactone decarboxylase family protein [Rubrobacter indicoceani]